MDIFNYCKTKLKKPSNVFLIVAFIIYAVFTFVLVAFRQPYWDEARVFNISCLPFKDILSVTINEGHGLFWYYMVKLAGGLKTYPFSMLFLNWIFAMGAMVLLLKKAPFTRPIKILLMFCAQFLWFFPVVARGYTVCLFLLFAICSLYPKRFKHPYIFTLLITLTLNTELLFLFPAFFIGLIFIYESYQRYKQKIFKKCALIFSISMFVLGNLSFLLQTVDFTNRFKTLTSGLKGINVAGFVFRDVFFSNPFTVIYVLLFFIILASVMIVLFKKTKKGFSVLFGSWFAASAVFLFVYVGCPWNYHVYFIYLILALWLFASKVRKYKFINVLFTILLVIGLNFDTINYKNLFTDMLYFQDTEEIAQWIANNPELKGAKLYCLDWWSKVSPGADVYLAKKGITLYDPKGHDRRSLQALKDVYQNKVYVSLDDFYDILNPNEKNYIIADDSVLGNMNLMEIRNEFSFQKIAYDEKHKISVYKMKHVKKHF